DPFVIAGQPAQVVDQHRLEQVRLRVGEHSAVLGPLRLVFQAGDGAVGIPLRDGPACPRGVLLAVADLIIDRGLLLPITGKSCMDCATCHDSVLLPVTSPRPSRVTCILWTSTKISMRNVAIWAAINPIPTSARLHGGQSGIFEG